MKRLLTFVLLLPLLAYGQFDGLGTFKAQDIWATGYVNAQKKYHAAGGFQDSTTSISLTQNNYATVTNASGTLWNGFEADGFSLNLDTLTNEIPDTNDLFVNVHITFSGQNTNEYQFRVYDITNGHIVGFEQGVTATGATNYQQVSMSVYIDDAVYGDMYALQVQNISGSNGAVFRHAQFYIRYEHSK